MHSHIIFTQDTNTILDLYHNSCDIYQGGVCDTYLVTAGMNNVTTLHSMTTTDQNLVMLFDTLDSIPTIVSTECNKAVKPLLCHYTYPFCMNNISYQFPYKEECEYVRDISCVVEWQIALSLMPDILPNCDLLDAMDEASGQQNDLSTDEVPVCPKHFKLFCNETCLPLCNSFSDHDDHTTSNRIFGDVSAGILGITGGVLLIIISVIRRDSMYVNKYDHASVRW